MRDTPASVLTQRQREYIESRTDITDDAKRKMRSRITNRRDAGIRDLARLHGNDADLGDIEVDPQEIDLAISYLHELRAQTEDNRQVEELEERVEMLEESLGFLRSAITPDE